MLKLESHLIKSSWQMKSKPYDALNYRKEKLKTATGKTRNRYYTYTLVYVDNLVIFDKYSWKYMAMLESK